MTKEEKEIEKLETKIEELRARFYSLKDGKNPKEEEELEKLIQKVENNILKLKNNG